MTAMELFSMREEKGRKYVLKTAIFIACIVCITILFKFVIKNWLIYSLLMGVILGLTIGYIIIVSISQKVQIAVIGIISGMGLDFLATGLKGAPKTAINSLATLISDIVYAFKDAAEKTGLPVPLERNLSIGLWVFFGTVALVMLYGSLEKTAI